MKFVRTILICIIMIQMISCRNAEAEIGEKGVTQMGGKRSDYYKIGLILNVNEKEDYYETYVDYLCYLKEKYPTYAAFKEKKTGDGHIEVRTWESDDFIMRAIWDEVDGGQQCNFEWIWKNDEIKQVVTGLIQKGEQQLLQEAQVPIENVEEYKEERLAVADLALKGIINEITENNFIKGVYINFSGDDIVSLVNIIKEFRFVNEVGYEKGKEKYYIYLYGDQDGILLSLTIDEDGEIWCADNRIGHSDDFKIWFDNMISDEK